MGNLLTYPPSKEQKQRQRQLAEQNLRRWASESAIGTMQSGRRIMLPYNEHHRDGFQDDTAEEQILPDPDCSLDLSQFEVETVKLETAPPSRESSFRSGRRYIKRYRSEEEKLIDILKEKDITINTAIRQGQTLRAKCNRYQEELESLKALSDVDMTDLEWRRRYQELDDKYRTLKEELDIMTVRNKNGRQYVHQQDETIQVLQSELQREKIEKSKMMSQSLRSLQSLHSGKGGGSSNRSVRTVRSVAMVKDKKGRKTIHTLQADRTVLQDRVTELTARNQRGRAYLEKLEIEKRQQEEMIESLRSRLQKEKAEKDALLTKVNILSASQEHLDRIPLYAQVDKQKQPSETQSTAHSSTTTAVSVEHHTQGSSANHSPPSANHSPPGSTQQRTDSAFYSVADPYEDIDISGGKEQVEIEEHVSLQSESSDDTSNPSPRAQTPESDKYIITEPIWDDGPQNSRIHYEESVTTKF